MDTNDVITYYNDYVAEQEAIENADVEVVEEAETESDEEGVDSKGESLHKDY